jgi:hypothetical protein
MVNGWGRIRGRGKDRGRKWMRRGRKSSWEGEQWIVAQEKEGRGKNRNKKIVLVKLIIQKKAGTATAKSSVCLVKVLDLFL